MIVIRELKQFLEYNFEQPDDNLDLPESVAVVQANQVAWHMVKSSHVQLEKQCARLERRVQEYNDRNGFHKIKKGKIPYTNPYQWIAEIKIAFDTGKTKNIELVDPLPKVRYIITRLTKNSDIEQICKNLFGSLIMIKGRDQFGRKQSVIMSVSSIFKERKTNFAGNPKVNFIADNQEGENRTITMTAKNVNDEIFEPIYVHQEDIGMSYKQIREASKPPSSSESI